MAATPDATDVARFIRALNGIGFDAAEADVDLLDQLQQLEAASRDARQRLRPESPALTAAEITARYGHDDL